MAGDFPQSAVSSRALDVTESWRCMWTSGHERCHFPGSVTVQTRGGGPWYCRHHFFCGDAKTGHEIVEQSRGFRPGIDKVWEIQHAE